MPRPILLPKPEPLTSDSEDDVYGQSGDNYQQVKTEIQDEQEE
jgi:hypothetical protein